MLQILKKHVKHFTNPKHDIAQYVYFIGDGSVIATDAHKLVRILDVHTEVEHTRKVDLKTVVTEPVKNAPRFERLIPTATATFEVELDVNETLKALAAVEAALSASDTPDEPVQLIGTTDGLVLHGKAHVSHSWKGHVQIKTKISDVDFDGLSITFNLTYFIQCLKLFKDFKYDFVTLGVTEKFKPMKFTVLDEAVEMILLPVRKC